MIETLRQENLSKLDRLQDSLETTQTDLVQAVQSEVGKFTNPRAIEQAFNMVTDQSLACKRPFSAGVKHDGSSLRFHKINNSPNLCHHDSSGVVHAVEWRSHKYRFAIGTLLVEHVESVDVDTAEGEDAQV